MEKEKEEEKQILKKETIATKAPNTKEYHLFDPFVISNCSYVHTYFVYKELFKRYLIVVSSKAKREQRESSGKRDLNSIL